MFWTKKKEVSCVNLEDNAKTIELMEAEKRKAFLKDVAFHYYRRLKKVTKGIEDHELRSLAEERVNAVASSNPFLPRAGWYSCDSARWSHVFVPEKCADYSTTEVRAAILAQLELRHAT